MIELLAALLIVCPPAKDASKPAAGTAPTVHRVAHRVVHASKPEVIRVQHRDPVPTPAPQRTVLRERRNLAPWLIAGGAVVAASIIASQPHDREVRVNTSVSSSGGSFNDHGRGHGRH